MTPELTPHLEVFDAHGVRMTLTVPAEAGEAAAAAEIVRRLAVETAPRWERVFERTWRFAVESSSAWRCFTIASLARISLCR